MVMIGPPISAAVHDLMQVRKGYHLGSDSRLSQHVTFPTRKGIIEDKETALNIKHRLFN